MVATGAGLWVLSKRLVLQNILANDYYIDFMELPPATGESRAINQVLESQVIMVQEATYTYYSQGISLIWRPGFSASP